MIILLVSTSRYIYSPMHFFLSHLSFNDVLLTTTIVPQMLHIILEEGSNVSLAACFSQFYFFSLSIANECLLLTVMSYDRYLAICNPLRYSSIMDLGHCLRLVILSWGSGIGFPLPSTFMFAEMTFCGSNVMDHFFCDSVAIIKRSCTDTSMFEMGNVILSIPIVFFPLMFITITYIKIGPSIFKISTTTGRQKAFSTCTSHLSVVCLYYGTLVINYVVPSKELSLGIQKFISVLYTMLTPLLNAIIYSLRNEEIRRALLRFMLRKRQKKL
ncbi:olfactory receptor 11L1-like [Pelodytes ibericus]